MATLNRPDPSAYPIGSPKSRAAARLLLQQRGRRPATAEDNELWHRVKGAHARMRRFDDPCCDPATCSFCFNDTPPAYVKVVSGGLAETIRILRQRFYGNDVPMLNAAMGERFE